MHRRLRVVAAAVGAGVLGLAAMGVAPAHAQEPNPSQICDLFLEEGLESILGADISHGACVALVAAENPVPLFVSICKSPEAIAVVEEVFHVDIPEGSVGQCVKFLKMTLSQVVGKRLDDA